MKFSKIALILLFPFMVAFNFSEHDKQEHMMAGGAISFFTYQFAKREVSKPTAILVGFLAGTAMGIAKELKDKKIDSQDIQATSLGALGGVCIPMTWEF